MFVFFNKNIKLLFPSNKSVEIAHSCDNFQSIRILIYHDINTYKVGNLFQICLQKKIIITYLQIN